MKLSKKLPQINNRPIGENSPNLVTLLETEQASKQRGENVEKRILAFLHPS
jgi:hypothetical protein